VLELRLGEPGWYGRAVAGVFLAVVAGLVIEPLQPIYMVLLLASALLIIWLDSVERKKRAQFIYLSVTQDFSLMLRDEKGAELSVERINRCWVSARLIVLPVRLANGTRQHLFVAQSRNHPDAFRRFAIICRFGFAVDDSEGHNVAQLNPKEA
jgi:hypothetical protein